MHASTTTSTRHLSSSPRKLTRFTISAITAAFALVCLGIPACLGQASGQEKFWVELHYPNGGSSAFLTEMKRPTGSGVSETFSYTGPDGNRVGEHFIISEFELLSIHDGSVAIAFGKSALQVP